MLLSNKMTVTIWLTLIRFYLRIWPSSSWILPSAAKAFPASVTKKLALIPYPTSNLALVCTYVRMYNRWDDSHFLIYGTIPSTPSLCKTIVVPYVDINAKVTNFFTFCTIGISMYQNRILPYFIIPSTFSPQASSPLEHYGRKDRCQHPPIPYFFFFPLSARGPTRRRNSTGLAELWGGWSFEQDENESIDGLD